MKRAGILLRSKEKKKKKITKSKDSRKDNLKKRKLSLGRSVKTQVENGFFEK